MRVFVSTAMTQSSCITVAILKVLGHIPCAFLLNELKGFEVRGGCVGFWCGGKVKRGLHDRVNPLGQADIVKSLGSRVCDYQAHRVAQSNILTCQNDQPAQDEARVLACIEHLRQPVQGRVGVGTAYRLDEGGNGVIMGIPVFIVQDGPALDGVLRNRKGDVDDILLVRWGEFNRQFEGISKHYGHRHQPRG